MARVWPDRVVEENNLQSQIVALRKVFGAERELIRTVSGRGYQFTGDARILPALADDHVRAELVRAQLGSTLPPTNLPHAVSALIGRDEELGEILDLAAAHRLVTLTGAGGIGKTRLALALARDLLPHFADGVWIAELASLADPSWFPPRSPPQSGSISGSIAAPPNRWRGARREENLAGPRHLRASDRRRGAARRDACCGPVRLSASSRPATNPCGRKVSGSIALPPLQCRRRIHVTAARASRRRGSPVRGAGAGGRSAFFAPDHARGDDRGRSAGSSTASRWRSSWRRRASRRSASMRSPPGSTTASGC